MQQRQILYGKMKARVCFNCLNVNVNEEKHGKINTLACEEYASAAPGVD